MATALVLSMSFLLSATTAAGAVAVDMDIQFGDSSYDWASSVAVDSSGNVYLAGLTAGALPGQTYSGATDAFVRKYSSLGTELWTHQFGSSTRENDSASSVAVDSSGNVYVTGTTYGALPGQKYLGYTDAFVCKYNSSGAELWTRQFGTSSGEWPSSVALDSSGNVYVAGETTGALPGQTKLGQSDAFLRKYSSSGAELWTRQFGTASEDDAGSLAIDSAGNAYVAGDTDVAPPNQSASYDAYVRKYDSSGAEIWAHQFGTAANDNASSVAVDSSSNLYVAGQTEGTLPGQTSLGSEDGFLRKYNSSGTELWTRQFGTSSQDYVDSLAVDASGNAYIAGSMGDAFVRKYNPSGVEVWRVSTSGSVSSVAVAASGNVYVVGGRWPIQGLDNTDAFLVRIDQTAPSVTAPVHSLAANTQLSTSTVPVRVTWGGSDTASGISTYQVQQRKYGGTAWGAWGWVTQGTTAKTLTPQLAPGQYQFQVRAMDKAGNWSAWKAGAAFRVAAYQETSTAADGKGAYTGAWSSESLSSAYGGSTKHAAAGGSYATFSFTGGKQVAWVAPKDTNRGYAYVYLDGVKVATVDLYSASAQSRRVVLARTGLDPSVTHTLEVHVRGTKQAASSGTRVDVDAFVVVR